MTTQTTQTIEVQRACASNLKRNFSRLRPAGRWLTLAVGSLLVAFSASAQTVLLSDNFNEGTANGDASTFNNNLSLTQGGTLSTINYNVLGSAWMAQHSAGGSSLLVATSDWGENGNVSLNNNFAAQANLANAPLLISFNIIDVFGYADTTKWVQFNIGNSQNLDVANAGVGFGALFRVNGGGQVLSAGNGLANTSWAANNLITITLSDTAGTGSAFNGNGSKATFSIGATDYGSVTLAQQTSAYLTFSGYNYGAGFGVGQFDNLSVSLASVPEPSTAALGLLGAGLCFAMTLNRGKKV